MKLAISNIAWPHEDEPQIAELMERMGVRGVEVAPTAVWHDPAAASADDVARYRASWNEREIEVVALQAILYGRPELTVFESADARARTLDYLGAMMRLGRDLGARVLVFGAPKNRLKGALSDAAAEAIAVDFFADAGAMAADNDVVLCIEPNPRAYGADFVTESRAGLELVERVASPGFGLHLDAAGMALAGEDLERAIERCGGAIRHFHASEPELGPIGLGGLEHNSVANALDRIGYSNWVSAEMRHSADRPTVPEIERVLRFLQRTYS